MTFANKPRRGPNPKLSDRGARSLVRIACDNPRMTLKALSTPSKSGKKLNYYTVAIILKSFGKKQASTTQEALLDSFAQAEAQVPLLGRKIN